MTKEEMVKLFNYGERPKNIIIKHCTDIGFDINKVDIKQFYISNKPGVYNPLYELYYDSFKYIMEYSKDINFVDLLSSLELNYLKYKMENILK